jgi:hypothetical protein
MRVQVKISKPNAYMSQTSNLSMQFQAEDELPVVIKWHGALAKRVTIAGSWDGWKKSIPLVKSNEDFSTIIDLPEGLAARIYGPSIFNYMLRSS